MPPKVAKVDLRPFPKRDENFTINAGFQYGKGDNPPLYGQKVIPVGKPNCLLGNTFVPTGTMVSLKREQVKDLITKYGGKVTSSISGKTDCVVVGCIEVGPKKIQTCREKNIPTIDEDGLFYLIARSDPEKNKDFIKKFENQQAGVIEEIEEKKEAQEEIKHEETIKENIKEKKEQNKKYLNFAEKYRPSDLKDFIGAVGAKNQLREYLSKFPNVKNKIALISGDQGCGKTTLAHLMASSLGFHCNELNASDVRTKGEIQNFLDVTTSGCIETSKKKGLGKECLIFDEIDGMGAGDRGGISAIASLAKTTKIPIICITTGKSDKKFDPLLKICESINIPKIERGLMCNKLITVAKSEGINISQKSIQSIAERANGDLRYALNSLEFWSASDNGFEKAKSVDNAVDGTRFILSMHTSFEDKFNCAFADDAMPLYVQYNLHAPQGNRESALDYADALDATCFGDIVERELKETQNYSLSTPSNYLSCVLPTMISKNKMEPKLLSAQMPKIMMTYSKKSKLERIKQDIASSFKINDSDVYSTAQNAMMRIGELSKNEKYDLASKFMFDSNISLENVEDFNEFINIGKKNDFKLQKDLKKSYLAQHSEYDPLIVQTHGKKVKLEESKKKEKDEDGESKKKHKDEKKEKKSKGEKKKDEKKKEKHEKKHEKKEKDEKKHDKKEKDEKKKKDKK